MALDGSDGDSVLALGGLGDGEVDGDLLGREADKLRGEAEIEDGEVGHAADGFLDAIREDLSGALKNIIHLIRGEVHAAFLSLPSSGAGGWVLSSGAADAKERTAHLMTSLMEPKPCALMSLSFWNSAELNRSVTAFIATTMHRK